MATVIEKGGENTSEKCHDLFSLLIDHLSLWYKPLTDSGESAELHVLLASNDLYSAVAYSRLS